MECNLMPLIDLSPSAKSFLLDACQALVNSGRESRMPQEIDMPGKIELDKGLVLAKIKFSMALGETSQWHGSVEYSFVLQKSMWSWFLFRGGISTAHESLRIALSMKGLVNLWQEVFWWAYADGVKDYIDDKEGEITDRQLRRYVGLDGHCSPVTGDDCCGQSCSSNKLKRTHLDSYGYAVGRSGMEFSKAYELSKNSF